MRVSNVERVYYQKWIVFCASCWLCLVRTSSSPPSREAAICEGNILLQLASKLPGIHGLTASALHEDDSSEGHDRSSEAVPRATALRPLSSTPADETSKLGLSQVEIEVTRSNVVQHALIKAFERLLFNFAHGGAWNISIFVVIAVLGIIILCIMLNFQTGSRRRAEGGTFGNQFGTLPPKPVKSAERTRTRAPKSTSPRPPSGSGSASSPSSRPLCPGLIVPEKSDCVLVIRILPNIVEHDTDIGDAAAGRPLASSRGAIDLDIFDLMGKPVLSASIVKPLPKQGNAVVTLQTLGAQLAPGQSGCLTTCRVGGIEKSINIYAKDDTLFGCISRDRSTSRYVLTSSRGDVLLAFDGSFQDHRIKVFDRHHSVMAHAEPCKMTFDREGHFYQARIASGVDVGLVLSGLLAIDIMEAQ